MSDLNKLFNKVVDEVLDIESYHLDEWDLECKGSLEERREWYSRNKFECVSNYYNFQCLDAWRTRKQMEQDVGDCPLYLDVIKLVTGKELPLEEEV